jgi:hypothetical protein
MMRKLTFGPYTQPSTEDVAAKLPTPVRIWALLFQALTRNPQWRSDNVLEYRASARLLDKFETLSVEEQDGTQTKTRLKYEGAEVLLEDAEFARLESAWTSFRVQIGDGNAREKVLVDDFLAHAPTVEVPHIGLTQ